MTSATLAPTPETGVNPLTPANAGSPVTPVAALAPAKKTRTRRPAKTDQFTVKLSVPFEAQVRKHANDAGKKFDIADYALWAKQQLATYVSYVLTPADMPKTRKPAGMPKAQVALRNMVLLRAGDVRDTILDTEDATLIEALTSKVNTLDNFTRRLRKETLTPAAFAELENAIYAFLGEKKRAARTPKVKDAPATPAA